MTLQGTVGVVGGGLMGAGIAQVAAQAGHATILRELDDSLCTKARATIERSLRKAVEKGKLAPDSVERTMAHLTFTTDLGALSACDIVVEAIVEELEAKRGLWRALDAVAAPHAIFASNTSSLSIVEQAVVTQRRDRFVGLHFFNPVPAMRLVEVVRTVTTSDDTMRSAHDFVRSIGKEPIAARDTPGFVVNLLLVPYMLDAVRALERGVATVADLDVGMQLGAGHPMGPLALCDFVGLDTLHRVAEIMYGAYREMRYAPPPLLTRLVVAGMLGKKSGRGFYTYGGEVPVPNDVSG
ncbi:MAG TPA: 3-hydroxybutyryl-CoA dehydrogenase [Gemmatimonadaceae bacterium]|nr:3-hydroxybutyryl-CoA dehydrogenase [Gemmatimonadaceae bacterium]